MASNNQVNLPGGFGGLVRYNEEYASFFNLKPTNIIVFIILIIGFRFALGALLS